MNGNRYYGVRVEGAKYGVSFGSALAIAISYTANHSILWAIVHGIFGLAVCDLLRPVSVVAVPTGIAHSTIRSRRLTVMC
jgi:hypothetical protein